MTNIARAIQENADVNMSTCEVDVVRTHAEWLAFSDSSRLKTRISIQNALVNIPLPRHIPGYCEICGKNTQFLFTGNFAAFDEHTGAINLAYSENGRCNGCNLNSRMRFAIEALLDLVPSRDANIYLTEHDTGTHKALGHHYSNITTSEWMDAKYAPGQIVGNIRHEDLHNLSFSDGSFDAVVCLDVLEHVNNPVKAVQEVVRVMKSDGIGILTFPFYPRNVETLRRSVLTEQGTVQHLAPPVYHRAPYKTEGSLVFNDFGWDFVAEMKQIGPDVHPLLYWSPYRCHFGHNRFAFVISRRR